jgi:short chain dehydrogenase
MRSGSRSNTPFGRTWTADQVMADVDLSGKRAIVTGGASGIGTETARALAAGGAAVTLTARDTEAGQKAAAGSWQILGQDGYWREFREFVYGSALASSGRPSPPRLGPTPWNGP